jgi:hypothetical protein
MQAQWLMNLDSIPGRSKEFFNSLHYLHQLWCSNQAVFFVLEIGRRYGMEMNMEKTKVVTI